MRRVDQGEGAVEREEEAGRLLRAYETHLISTAPDDSPQARRLGAVRAEVRKLRRRMEEAGLTALEMAAEVRALLAAEGLERVAAHAEATVTANLKLDRHRRP